MILESSCKNHNGIDLQLKLKICDNYVYYIVYSSIFSNGNVLFLATFKKSEVKGQPQNGSSELDEDFMTCFRAFRLRVTLEFEPVTTHIFLTQLVY